MLFLLINNASINYLNIANNYSLNNMNQIKKVNFKIKQAQNK